MYLVILRFCILIILGLLSNQAREISTGTYGLVFSSGLTLLFSCELGLGYLLFLTNKPVVRKAFGYCLVLHMIYPSYLVVAFAFLSEGTALLEPLSAGVLLGIIITLSVAFALIRLDASGPIMADRGGVAFFPVFFFLTYTPFIVMGVWFEVLPSGLTNDYNWFLYVILVELGLSLVNKRLIKLVAPSIALFSVVYVVTQMVWDAYTGRAVWLFVTLHCLYAVAYGGSFIRTICRKAA